MSEHHDTPSDLDLARGLSRTRRIEMLSGHDDWHLVAVPEIGLDAIMVTDGPHGLRKVPGGGLLDAMTSLPATCYPTASATGASWDRALVADIGRELAREAWAQGVSVILGPGVNIKRHPACGRNFEYFAEDPLLAGELAAAFVNGAQSLGIGTSLKHFAVNNQETRRMTVDVIVDERTLREIYLPAFEIAVTRAQPWTVMSAYNRVNGTYCCEHPQLLQQILRDEWGFAGLVVSDWGANNDRVAAVRAGLDLEMPGGASAHDEIVAAALDSGELSDDDVNACVARVVHLQRAALAASTTVDPEAVAFDADRAHALARRAATESMVLLTNVGAALPLAPTGRIAVIGGFAAEPRIQGSGSSRVNPTRVDRPLDELRSRVQAGGGSISVAAGYRPDGGTDDALVAEALAAAEGADAVVVFVGLPDTFEAEGADRDHLRLPDGHNQLVWALTERHTRVVVVLIAGSAVELEWRDEPAAILLAHLGGQAMGAAVADVVFGDAEPGGRLAETFPLHRADLASDPWFPGTGRQVQYREGLLVGYRWSETVGAAVAFPFGHGLSYTTFEFADAALSAATSSVDDTALDTTVRVTNTGERAGSTVVQVYVRPIDAAVDRPDRELRGFAKVHLDPGASTTVTIALDRRAFAHWDVASGSWRVCSGEYEVLVATSVRDVVATLPVRVQGDVEPATDRTVAPYRRTAGGGVVVSDDQFATLLGRSIPTAQAARPFTLNSTMGELGDTLLGRLPVTGTRRVLGASVRRRSGDGGLAVMIEQGFTDLPLRNVATIPKGPSIAALKRFVAMANRLAWSKRSSTS